MEFENLNQCCDYIQTSQIFYVELCHKICNKSTQLLEFQIKTHLYKYINNNNIDDIHNKYYARYKCINKD